MEFASVGRGSAVENIEVSTGYCCDALLHLRMAPGKDQIFAEIPKAFMIASAKPWYGVEDRLMYRFLIQVYNNGKFYSVC